MYPVIEKHPHKVNLFLYDSKKWESPVHFISHSDCGLFKVCVKLEVYIHSVNRFSKFTFTDNYEAGLQLISIYLFVERFQKKIKA